MENKVTNTESDNSITLNDLVMCRNLIHIASKRGAYSAEEFSEIGPVYNKIDGFLKKNIKQESNETMSKESSGESETEKSKIEI